MATNGMGQEANGSPSRRPFPVDFSDEDIQSSRSKRVRRATNGHPSNVATTSEQAEKKPQMKDSSVQTLAPKKRAPLSDAETKELYELDCKKWSEIVEQEYWQVRNADGSLSTRWPKKLNVPRQKFWRLYCEYALFVNSPQNLLSDSHHFADAKDVNSRVPNDIDGFNTDMTFQNLKLSRPPWYFDNFELVPPTRYRYPMIGIITKETTVLQNKVFQVDAD